MNEDTSDPVVLKADLEELETALSNVLRYIEDATMYIPVTEDEDGDVYACIYNAVEHLDSAMFSADRASTEIQEALSILQEE